MHGSVFRRSRIFMTLATLARVHCIHNLFVRCVLTGWTPFECRSGMLVFVKHCKTNLLELAFRALFVPWHKQLFWTFWLSQIFQLFQRVCSGLQVENDHTVVLILRNLNRGFAHPIFRCMVCPCLQQTPDKVSVAIICRYVEWIT